MGSFEVLPRPKILVLFLFTLIISLSSAGLFSFTLPIPFISFQKTQPHQHHHHHHPQHVNGHSQELHHHDQHHHHHHPQHIHEHSLEHHHDDHHHHHHHNVLDHAHLDQQGKLYLHDPESTVKFYYKENLLGPSNLVDIHHDGCREVPMDYWYNRPKSLWAKHCITLYQSGHCKGEGVKVAGTVRELRSAGMYYGVNSFKPCEKNIRVRFLPSGHHDKHHHHHHHHH